MFGSRNIKNGIVLALYNDRRTVFRFRDVALITGETDIISLQKKLNYYVKTGKIGNPRRGIYTKPEHSPEELALILYTPSYISLGYVLQRSGIIFQYDAGISCISYLSRSVEIAGKQFQYRKVKGEVLVNPAGIERKDELISMAIPERAYLDQVYLEPKYYFDNLSPLNHTKIKNLLPLYQSKALTDRVLGKLSND